MSSAEILASMLSINVCARTKTQISLHFNTVWSGLSLFVGTEDLLRRNIL